MKETVAKLKKARLTVLLANLIYFLAVLALGFLIFVKGRGGLLYGLVAAALAAYLALIRPLTARYKRTARESLLRENVCRGMSDFTYLPKAGFTAREFQEAGLMAGDTGKAFLSRELVTARKGSFRLKMADVTFPVRKDGLNAMFNGLLLHITSDSAAFPELRRTSDDETDVPPAARALLEQLPGEYSLRTGSQGLYLLLRGRFIGFPVNPLLHITEKTMETALLPEAAYGMRLAQVLSTPKNNKERN